MALIWARAIRDSPSVVVVAVELPLLVEAELSGETAAVWDVALHCLVEGAKTAARAGLLLQLLPPFSPTTEAL